MPDEQPLVKCADCGYLGLRHTTTRQLLEADEVFRQKGQIRADGNHWLYDEHPVCFAQKINFREKIGNQPHNEYELRGKVVQAEWNCNGFIKWQPGLTPKEHQEMMMLEEQRKWQL